MTYAPSVAIPVGLDSSREEDASARRGNWIYHEMMPSCQSFIRSLLDLLYVLVFYAGIHAWPIAQIIYGSLSATRNDVCNQSSSTHTTMAYWIAIDGVIFNAIVIGYASLYLVYLLAIKFVYDIPLRSFLYRNYVYLALAITLLIVKSCWLAMPGLGADLYAMRDATISTPLYPDMPTWPSTVPHACADSTISRMFVGSYLLTLIGTVLIGFGLVVYACMCSLRRMVQPDDA